MTKKRLLIVSDYYLPHWTGIVKTVSYMNDAVRKWFDIIVVTTRHDKNLQKTERVNDVQIIREPVLLTISRAQLSFSLLVRIAREIPSSDIVFINSPSAYMLFASLCAKLAGKKLLIFHQGDLTLPKGALNWLIERIFDISFFISCLLADTVFCPTKDYALNSRVLKSFMGKFKVLPILAKQKASSSIFNQKMKYVLSLKKQGYAIFGFAGRFVEEKGFDLLLQAIPSVVKKNPTIHFVFAGALQLSYEKFFEQNKSAYSAVKKHITATGVLKEKELESFYQLVDAVVIPSRSDCFPTVQVEAMLRQRPIIVTDIPGARAPVKETGFGILIPRENIQGLANAILKMSKNKNAYIKSFKNVLSYFNFQRDVQTVKKYLTD